VTAARALAAAGFAWNFIPQQSWVLLVVYAISASVLTVWLWMTG
jgi:hypothetical protein